MARASTNQVANVELQSQIQLQTLLASIIPVAAVGIVGVVGTEKMSNGDAIFFLAVGIVCAVGVFFGERTILRRLQGATNGQFTDITVACQEFLAGNVERRIPVQANEEMQLLGQTVNMLLNRIQMLQLQPPPKPQPTPEPEPERALQVQSPQQQQIIQRQQREIEEITQQIDLLATELSPVVDGDLRVKAEIGEGNLGIIADICNSLIEELAQFTRWTHYAADQVITSSKMMLERAIDMAETTETQMMRISETTDTVERMIAFIQRMGSTLQLSVDLSQETQEQLQNELEEALSKKEIQEQFESSTERQMSLIGEVLDTTQETATVAESVINDLYTFAQQIHESSTSVLETAEKISSLATLAERWRTSAEAFYLPEDDEQYNEDGEENEDYHGPTPSPVTRGVKASS